MEHYNGSRKLLRNLLDEPNLKVLETASRSSSSDMWPFGSLRTSEYSTLSYTSRAILVAIVVTFFLFSIFYIYVRRLADRRTTPERSPAAASSSSTFGVGRVAVGSLPINPYHCDPKYQIDCAICLTEFEADERVKTIPFCRHMFHPQCIDTWLFSHVSCPICRTTRFFLGKSGIVGRSTVRNCDTCVELGTRGLRRVSSCSSFHGRASLRRTLSF